MSNGPFCVQNPAELRTAVTSFEDFTLHFNPRNDATNYVAQALDTVNIDDEAFVVGDVADAVITMQEGINPLHQALVEHLTYIDIDSEGLYRQTLARAIDPDSFHLVYDLKDLIGAYNDLAQADRFAQIVDRYRNGLGVGSESHGEFEASGEMELTSQQWKQFLEEAGGLEEVEYQLANIAALDGKLQEALGHFFTGGLVNGAYHLSDCDLPFFQAQSQLWRSIEQMTIFIETTFDGVDYIQCDGPGINDGCGVLEEVSLRGTVRGINFVDDI